MKLSRLYSNDDRFSEIVFKDGINLVLATGEKPHSIGKSTFLDLIDYCLLKSDLTKLLDSEKLRNFVFFLEIKKKSGEYLTIKRKIDSKEVWFEEHSTSANLKDKSFQYCFKIDKASKFLSEKLGFSINGIQNQNFRIYLSYFIREKADALDAFKPNKFKGKDSSWKPFVASMMGINIELISEKIKLDKTKVSIQNIIKVLESDFLVKDINEKEIKQFIESHKQEIERIEKSCKNLDLFAEDEIKQRELIDQIDKDIANLNSEKYRLATRNRLINQTMKKQQEINLERIQKLFGDMNIYFKEELIKSFDDVVAFNNKISKDSNFYLEREKKENDIKLQEIDYTLKEQNDKRKQILENITQDNILEKIMQLMQESSELKLKIKSQEDLIILLDKYKQNKNRLAEVKDNIQKISKKINHEISKENNPKLKKFLDDFTKYSQYILLENGNVNVALNGQNNIDFELKSSSLENQENSKSKGETFSKIHCFIFNLCSILLHQDDNFFNFVLYDGLFDGVATEYINRTIELMKDMEKNGIQIIFTDIEKDIQDSCFYNELRECCLLRELADTDEKRLFAMAAY